MTFQTECVQNYKIISKRTYIWVKKKNSHLQIWPWGSNLLLKSVQDARMQLVVSFLHYIIRCLPKKKDKKASILFRDYVAETEKRGKFSSEFHAWVYSIYVDQYKHLLIEYSYMWEQYSNTNIIFSYIYLSSSKWKHKKKHSTDVISEPCTLTHSRMVALWRCTAWESTETAFISMLSATYLE